MNANHPVPETASPEPRRAARVWSKRRLLRRAGWAGAAGLAPLAVVWALYGCGKESDRSYTRTSARVAAVERAAEPVQVASQAPPAPAPVKRPGVQAADGPIGAGSSGASLPPDIVVSVPDTLVSPGEPVEITARATPDVVEVVLWDGINDKQALLYDSVGGVWRATYRVPLSLPWERAGLSVTAKTDAHRWRRVWVFLRIGPSAEPGADTVSAP